MNDAWEDELQLYAPLTIEEAPENFVERVMARINGIDNFTVVTEPVVSVPRHTGGRIRRIFPIAATAAAVMLLFAMPALRRGGLTGLSAPDTATPSALENAETPKAATRQYGGEDGSTEDSEEKADTITSFDASSIAGIAPEEGALPQESPAESKEADNGLPTPFKSALSRSGGGTIDAGEGKDYCLLYGATSRPAGIAFCVILEGGTPPEDVLPVVPSQYLVTSEQLEALLTEQPEGVEPQYVEEGLTPSATLGLVIIKQPSSDD